ncbi:MAG: hypothetical protein DRN49_00990 [Thaumarchaeota archaeon]|nr:MAG: hypothetical protein DRN49_00990 [Nitrososphaerota archaeon]
MVFLKDGEPVSPGEPICVAEEYMPGENVKLDKRGVIVSILRGRVSYDHERRIVRVEPLKLVEKLKVGDRVLVEVKEVQDKIAIASILSVNGKLVKHPRTAVILPNPGMKKTMDQYVGIGDLVVASVVTTFMGIIGLSIWRQDLGVVLARCNKCSGILKKVRKSLICVRCGGGEKRKIVPQYGSIAYLISLMG